MYALNVSGIGCDSGVSKITKSVQSMGSDEIVSVDRTVSKVKVENSERPERVREQLTHLVSLLSSEPEGAGLCW